MRFYRAYKKSKIDSLDSFYRQYKPPITPAHYTCVGLAYELIHRINSCLPQKHEAVNKIYIVSCEEEIETAETYVGHVPPCQKTVEKEHVLACLRIRIGGDRNGFMILDPGYHISRAVTVMDDGLYPHTGLFVQGETGPAQKEYEYTMVNSNYISWSVSESKKGRREAHKSLIFSGRHFKSAVEVAERRNLVYEFKSILRRDPKGRILAGLYFCLTPTDPKVTLFYMEDQTKRQTLKLNAVENFKDIPEIGECEHQMRLKKGTLIQKLNEIGRLMRDEGFVKETLDLNNRIMQMSALN